MASDYETYAEMMVPHESQEEAEKNSLAFFLGVMELRKKHRIANALIITEMRYKTDENGGASQIRTSSIGDTESALPLAAVVYGKLRQEHAQRIDALASGK